MADADIIINGGIVADPRWNTTQGGQRVGNLTVRAGRSRKNDQGGYDQLSSTPYDVACWGEVHDLLAAQAPEKGAQVRIVGQVTGVRVYEDRDGNSQASVEVRADGVKVFPKRQQQGQQGGWNGGGQQGGGQQNDPWGGGQAQQGGWSGQGGYDDPPF